jgi:hypothetical protein
VAEYMELAVLMEVDREEGALAAETLFIVELIIMGM